MPDLFSSSDRERVARCVADAYGVDAEEAARMVRDALSGQGDSEQDQRVAPFLWAQLGPAMERIRQAQNRVGERVTAAVVVPLEVARSRWAGSVFCEHPDLARLDRELEHFYGEA